NESRNQSSLNRLLTQSPFTLNDLNQARLTLLSDVPGTWMKRKGVLSVDDTLLVHTGEHFDQIANLKDPDTGHFVWAHDLVTLHYSDDDTDYPVRFQLWKPTDVDALEKGFVAAGVPLKESKQALKTIAPHKWRNYLQGVWRRHQDQPEVAALYQSKLLIGEQLLRDWVETTPSLRLPVTFDNWYTQPGFCQYLDETLHLDYVGTLASDDQVLRKSGPQRLDEWAEHLKAEHQAAVKHRKPAVFQPVTIHYKGEKEQYYSYCATHRIQTFGRQRLVINFREADLSDSPVFYISNNLVWQAPGITRIRRHRWPVEVHHEEGKAEGLDQYQLRDWQAIERHIGLVAVVYSLLRAAQHDPALQHKLQRRLQLDLEVGSMAFWRRVTQAQGLWALALVISAGLAHGQSLRTIMTPLVRALSAS
ncbi:MAG: transposase, partial [Chloroflexota bacterium]|nr:transposase [Chloroflexota bacterium]